MPPKSGFSMVEMLIALATSAALMLAIVDLVKISSHQTGFLSVKMGNDGIVIELRSSLASSQLCRQILNGIVLNFVGETDLNLTLLSGTVLKANTEVPNQKIMVRRIYASTPFAIGTTPRGNRFFQVSLFLDSNSNVALDGVPRVFNTIPIGTIAAEIDLADKIIDCSTLETEADLSRVACEQFGGAFDPTTMKCDMPIDVNKTCGALGGSMVSGRCYIPP